MMRSKETDDARSRINAIHGKPLKQSIVLRGLGDLQRNLTEKHKKRSADFKMATKLYSRMFAPLREIVSRDKGALEAMAALRKLTPRRNRPSLRAPTFPALKPQIKTGSLITVLAPPYDYEWTWGAPYDQNGGGVSNVGSSFADDSYGRFNLFASNGGTSINESAGVGVYFRPLTPNTWARFSAFVRFSYTWADDSHWGATAHNDGLINIFVSSWDLQGGGGRTELDQRSSMWSDGTGWNESHANPDSPNPNEGIYPVAQSTIYLGLSSDRQYAFWVWGNISCDASGGNDIVSSYASSELDVSVPFVVFEQWT